MNKRKRTEARKDVLRQDLAEHVVTLTHESFKWVVVGDQVIIDHL